MEIRIGRFSGPCTDQEAVATFDPKDYELIKDVLSMINAATQGKEGWYVLTKEHGHVVPYSRKP